MPRGAGWRWFVWCVAVSLPLPNVAASDIQPVSPLQIARDERVQVVLDSAAEQTARARAADSLVTLPGESGALVAGWLSPESEPGVRDLIIGALARASMPDAELQKPVLELLASSQPPSNALLQAAAGFRTREAFDALFARLNGAPGDTDVFAALRKLTGVTLPDDAGQWRGWIEARRSLTPREWDREILSNHADRARAEASARASAVTRLVDLYRRLLAAKPAAERAALLEEMIQAPESPVRLAAFELAHWELQSGRQVSPAFATLSMEQLKSPYAALRTEAAKLINRIGVEAGQGPVLAALEVEADAGAAAAMLASIAQRWPSPSARVAVLRWLEAPDAAGEAARRAALALYRAGHLSDPLDREAVLAALRAVAPENLQESGLRLLGIMGEPSDRRAIVGLLASPGAVPQTTIAAIVSGWPDSIDALGEAVRTEPTLYVIWGEALASLEPTAEGFTKFVSVPPPNQEQFLNVAERFATRMNAENMVRAAAQVGYTCRVRMLQHLVTHTGVEREREAVGWGLLDLAEAAIATQEAVVARVALTAVPEDSEAWSSPRASMIRIMVSETQEEIARVTEADAGVWLDAAIASLVLDPARTAAIISSIGERFGESLTEEQQARLASMSAYLWLYHEILGSPRESDPGPPRI